jgi:hypothetical protein
MTLSGASGRTSHPTAPARGKEHSVTLTGRLTHDPDLRSTNGGTDVCVLRIANNDGWLLLNDVRLRAHWHHERRRPVSNRRPLVPKQVFVSTFEKPGICRLSIHNANYRRTRAVGGHGLWATSELSRAGGVVRKIKEYMGNYRVRAA